MITLAAEQRMSCPELDTVVSSASSVMFVCVYVCALLCVSVLSFTLNEPSQRIDGEPVTLECNAVRHCVWLISCLQLS